MYVCSRSHLSKIFLNKKIFVKFILFLQFYINLFRRPAFEKLPKEFMSNCVNKISLFEKFAKQILSWKFYSNCEPETSRRENEFR